MTPRELAQYIGNLIANAEVETAFEQLIKFFNGNPEFRAIKSQVLYIQSQYKKTKRDEESGLVSFENARLNYNQITNQLLAIIGKLESGDLQKEAKQKLNTKRLAFLASLLLFVGLSWGVYYYLLHSGILGKDEYVCPEFGNGYKVLVLPFQPIGDGSKPSSLHKAILNRFEELASENNIDVDPQTLQRATFALSEKNYPNTAPEATAIGNACNSDLIIWGSTEDSGKDLAVRRRYQFLNIGENFKLPKIKSNEDTVEVIQSFTTVVTGNSITNDIERILLGVIAYQKGMTDESINLLSSSTAKSEEEALLKGTILASAQIESGDLEGALKTYDTLLTIHPNYGLALNNRGMLLYETGHYMEAVEDFSMHLETQTVDSSLYLARANAYLKAELYKEAKNDLDKVQKLMPRAKISKKLDEVEEKLAAEKRKSLATSMELRKDPSNSKLWQERAQSEYKIGDYSNAIKSAYQVIQKNPEDSSLVNEAKSLIISSLWAQKDTANLDRFLLEQASKKEPITLPNNATRIFEDRIKKAKN